MTFEWRHLRNFAENRLIFQIFAKIHEMCDFDDFFFAYYERK